MEEEEAARLLPTPVPRRICRCEDSHITVGAGRSIILITINGRYDFSLPCMSCSFYKSCWVPEVKDLLLARYWPATVNFQTVYAIDVFSSYEEMKTSAPALSRLAFVRMLEQRSLYYGRVGKICPDTFQRSFLEYSYSQFEKEKMCAKEHFVCPACTPDMLAVCVDGNRKHYRFRKSKGIGERAHYAGVFLAKDEDVSVFVDYIRAQITHTQGSATCGTSTWAAAKECSQRSSSKLDEEGIEVSVCRHGVLLKGLNMFRGEIFAYPMFLQKELASSRNVSLFCTDVMCRYWPYLQRVTGHFPELSSLTGMKPFLSVLHAKAHDWKCEIIWGGRNQEGSGTTIGEEVEQVNSFLSRVPLTTKYMTKAARNDMFTLQAMGWNSRKVESLHRALSQRYRKTKQRAKAEADSLQSFMVDLNCSVELRDQWVADVKQWALTVTDVTPGSPQELQKIIEGLFGSLREKKHNLYRQNDSNKQRQKKRRHLSKVKAKLLEAIHQYNPAVPNAEKIDVLAASDPDENVVWPWEMLPNGMYELQRAPM